MPVRFYVHTPTADDNEKRAIAKIARSLLAHFGTSQEEFALVAGVDFRNGYLKQFGLSYGLDLPELDAVLLSSRGVYLLEIKTYYDAILGHDPEGEWYVRGVDQPVLGGSNRNPYKQARNAKNKWTQYFKKQWESSKNTFPHSNVTLDWEHLGVSVLFSPDLHPESDIRVLGKDHKWLSFRGVTQVPQLTIEYPLGKLRLNAEEIEWLATKVLHATPWKEVSHLMEGTVGAVSLQQPYEFVTYPIHRWDILTIGRAKHHHIRIDKSCSSVSRTHAKIESTAEGVRLFNLSRSGKTFVKGEPISDQYGVLLFHGDDIHIGDNKTGCDLFFGGNSYTDTASLVQTDC